MIILPNLSCIEMKHWGNNCLAENNGSARDVLVLGIGNMLRKDDGVGCAVIQRILEMSLSRLPEHVEFIDGGTMGYGLIPYFMGRKRVIIIDALVFDDSPGSFYHFPPQYIRQNSMVNIFHSFNIPELLFHLENVGQKPDVEIIGIVPEDISSCEIGLSSPVEKSIPGIIEYILRLPGIRPLRSIIG